MDYCTGGQDAVDTEAVILIVVALGGLSLMVVGGVLLILYFRGGRGASEPVVYGELVQCPHCGYMNPMDAAACLNCRYPLSLTRQRPTPAYAAPPPGSTPVPPPLPGPAAFNPPQPAEATVGPPSQVAPPPLPPEQPRDVPNAWLEGVGGALMGQQAMLSQADTLVGRSTVCDVQIYDPKVSRRHFLIRYANGAFFLQDQQSSRGTRVNGEPVTATRLKPGDRIEIGDTTMVFRTG